MQNISSKEAYEKIGDFVIIDARTPEEYKGGYIKGALNIDASSPNFVNEIVKLDKNKKYLVYCNFGNRSFSVSVTMSNFGFSGVFNLEGGISNWINSGLAVEK